MDNTDKIIKKLAESQLKTDKQLYNLQKILKNLEKKVNIIINKVQEFEIVLDAAELIEEHIEDQESQAKDIFNTDWTPYNDEDFQSEDYENYDDNEEDV